VLTTSQINKAGRTIRDGIPPGTCPAIRFPGWFERYERTDDVHRLLTDQRRATSWVLFGTCLQFVAVFLALIAT